MTKPSSPTPARVRTRFAPSPTGFIHLGNIRSALYPWAFARAKGGDFVLRIEDTDLERSTQAAVDVILESMDWLGMKPDEGPYYQMQRMDRYKEVLARLQAAGHVYPCYMSKQELDALRARQEAAREKPRYDGTWRPEPGRHAAAGNRQRTRARRRAARAALQKPERRRGGLGRQSQGPH